MSNYYPDGGSAQKQKSNPKFKDIDKVGVVVVGVPNPPPPDQVELILAKDYNTALTELKIDKPINGLKDIEGEVIEDEASTTVKIRGNNDLQEKGIVSQIPTLQEQQKKKDALHKWHNKVTDSYRVKRVISKLYDPKSKDDLALFITALEGVSSSIRNYENPQNDIS